MSKNEEYTFAYQKNEISANKHMTYVLLFTALLLFSVLFGYIFHFFTVAQNTLVLTLIMIPVVIVVLCIPAFFLRSNVLAKPLYKYFVLSCFVLAIATLNVIMPKHAVLGWAVCVALTSHYYSPKASRIIFSVVIVLMLICLGLGTFYGEFDSNLLSGELNIVEQRIYSYRLPGQSFEDSGPGRYQYLKALIDHGENRFVKIFFQYYLGRALFITLIHVIILFLNKRTKVLLNSEIKVNNENEKNKTELEVAKDIQMNTLPAETLSSEDVEIVSELKAAKEVGGDLYDYLDIDSNHVAVLIGDVSGKGVPAAMFMMKTITSFRDFAKKGKTPSEILKQVNASIFKGNKAGLFVTCFLAILDKDTGKLVYANAGHNPPVVGYNGNYHYLKCKPGFLLGCFKDAFVEDEEIILQPGESITLYTDGITEARNPQGKFFGEERFLNVMNKRNYTCLLELHHTIKDEIANFVLDAPQSDDITFVSVKYHGDNYSYEEKYFDAKKENLIHMLSFINDFGVKYDFPKDFINKLVVVGDELLSNIIKYGYEDKGGDIFVRLLFNEDAKEFALTIIDRAKPFNQLAVDEEKVSGDPKKIGIGGLGLLIVKNIMTEYAYDYINGKNILMLKKAFGNTSK